MPTEQAARPRLVLATANAHKLTELTRILNAERVDVDLVGLGEFPGAPDVAETGATFVANALLKARVVAAFNRTAIGRRRFWALLRCHERHARRAVGSLVWSARR